MLWMTLPYMIGIAVAELWAGSAWLFLLASLVGAIACFFFKPSRLAGWLVLLFAIGFAFAFACGRCLCFGLHLVIGFAFAVALGFALAWDLLLLGMTLP